MSHSTYFTQTGMPRHKSTRCRIGSKLAPAANRLVGIIDNTICGHIYGENDALWTPGALNYVGGNGSVAAWSTLWKKEISDNPAPLTVGVLLGPPLNTITKAFLRAMNNAVPKAALMPAPKRPMESA